MRAALHPVLGHSWARRSVFWQFKTCSSSCVVASSITLGIDATEVKVARYRGVYPKGKAFFSQAMLQGRLCYIGSFSSAAKARDRGLKISGRNSQKEALAFDILQAAFAMSEYSSRYEIRRLSGASEADAVLMKKDCPEDCLLLQLKAGSGRGRHGRYYSFSHVSGYTGMVVLFIALEGGQIWAAPGQQLLKKQHWITAGHASAARFHVSDVGSFLAECFADTHHFPHTCQERATGGAGQTPTELKPLRTLSFANY